MNSIAFLKAAYTVAWVIYLGYLGRVLLRIKSAEKELAQMKREK